ncbi:colanic acid biosynthesis glycosyltransferase WcaI [Paenibacillus psychroresistens]|uniref:Colanic acid biosynthesis glycosyltransferase WcaI n=1 Tax=Paenibacillus psychroresistens TaxID=1778678 RepID=A0A6B8RVI9_9BACL|nr:colanic acid biosynthesis glycosyltransferase WcaI [Paenibacillus psychroresistens]
MVLKRILLYSLNFTPELTGIGKFNGEMVQWLTDQGYEVRVVTAPPYYPQWKINQGYSAHKYSKEIANGAEVWRCPIWIPSKLTGLKRLLHLASFALSSIPVILKQMWWRPQLVMVVEPPLAVAPIVVVLSKLFGIKSWLHVQDFEVDAAFDLGLLPENKALKQLVTGVETWLMRRFNIVSSISLQMMERLYNKGIEPARTRFFPNWVETNAIYPLEERPVYYREQLGINRNDFVVLYSGNMGAKQGLEIILDAAERLQEFKNIYFVICGEGSNKDKLIEDVKLRNLAQIKFIPLQPLEKLNLLLNTADVHALIQKMSISDLVMPSKLTGMMASGKAIIATAAKKTAVFTVMEQSRAGRVVSPEDPEQLAKVLLEMSENKAACHIYGLNARAYATEHLSKAAIMSAFEKSIKDLTTIQKSASSKSSVKDKGVFMK